MYNSRSDIQLREIRDTADSSFYIVRKNNIRETSLHKKRKFLAGYATRQNIPPPGKVLDKAGRLSSWPVSWIFYLIKLQPDFIVKLFLFFLTEHSLQR